MEPSQLKRQRPSDATESKLVTKGPYGLALRLLVFAIPLLLALMAMEIMLWRSGESWPIGRVVEEQNKEPRAIFGRRFFSQFTTAYKLEMIRKHKPDILVAGNSRVLQIREEFFPGRDVSFYNGGFLLRTFPDLEVLAAMFAKDELPTPKLIIVQMEPWFLLPGEQRKTLGGLGEEDEEVWNFSAHWGVMRSMVSKGCLPWKLLNPLYRHWSQICHSPAIGFLAAEGRGFRRDGSYAVGNHILEYFQNPGYRDRADPPIIQRVKKGVRGYKFRGGLSPKRITMTLSALKKIESLGTMVIVFFPPFSNEVVMEIERSPFRWKWWGQYWRELPARLARHGLRSFGIKCPSEIGLSDEYMLDGFHPGDVLAGHLIHDLVRQAPSHDILARIDHQRLGSLLKKASSFPIALQDCDYSRLKTEPE